MYPVIPLLGINSKKITGNSEKSFNFQVYCRRNSSKLNNLSSKYWENGEGKRIFEIKHYTGTRDRPEGDRNTYQLGGF